MKALAATIIPLIVGYIAGVAFFTISILTLREHVYDWAAIEVTVAFCTFTIGAALFLPAHFLIKKNSKFWRLWICGPFGAAIGFLAVWPLLGAYAQDFLMWSQATVIGATTYLVAGLLRKERPNQPPEPTAGLAPGRGSS